MLPPGKLPPDLLATCLRHTGAPEPRGRIGPRFDEDWAVIDKMRRRFGIDQLGPIGSGALLLTLPADKWPDMDRAYRAEAIPAAVA